MKQAMIFQVLKWIAFAVGAILGFAAIGQTANDLEMAAVLTSATFFILVAIFFHLEQHKS